MLKKSKILIPILCIALMLIGGVSSVSAAPHSIDIPIAHKSVGDSKAKEEVVHITLTAKTADGKTEIPMPDGTTAKLGDMATLELTGDGSDAFRNLQFSEDGKYKYEIARKEGTRTVVSYDKSVYEMEVIVENGKPHIVVTKKGTGEKVEFGDDVALEFEDEYKDGEYGPGVSAAPKVKKKVNGNGSYNNDTFTFTMTPTDDTSDLLGSEQTYKATVKGEGTATFSDVEFADPGTYVFTIKESATNSGSWKYDKSTYTYTVNVVYDDGALKIDSTTIKKGDKTVSSMSFTNTPTTTNKIISAGNRIFSNIKTGDPQQWMLLMVIIVGGGFIITFILAPKKRKKGNK